MHSSAITTILQRRTNLARLSFLRHMGGGARTFPGGLNKWQWKRLHEKKAREKEKRLLYQEKQVYQARVRSEIRAKISPASDQQPEPGNFNPLSPQEHIKALADRFMKEGAEDLWNEDDGPLKSMPKKPKKRISGEPVDIRKLFSENSLDHNFLGARKFSTWLGYGNVKGHCINSDRYMAMRCYSAVARGSTKKPKKFHFSKNESDSSEDDSDSEVREVGSMKYGRVRWPRLTDYSKDGDDEGSEEKGSRGKAKRMASSAALGKHDVTIKKKVPLQALEEEVDLSEQVEMIRYELKNRHLGETEVGKMEEGTIYSSKRFDEYDISPLTVRALNEAGYVQMTRVQEATLSTCLQGMDSLVKARTGTGKTAAFLLPAIETVLKASISSSNQRVPPIYVLILCPTRELASQIAAEATVLLKYHDGIGVQTLVGGTRFKVDQQRLESEPCQIIVATPGRLLDHVENKSGISLRLMGLKMLILDEADRLLDLGFRKDMEKIVDCLPRRRQSLLFSATIPKEVRRISQLILKREHAHVDVVGYGLETHPKVHQSFLVAPHEQHFQIVYHLLKAHISQVFDFKVVVFCTTAMLTSLMYDLLREMKMDVREIHSRKPQIYRTRISEEFKGAKRLILVTSDVSSRGMNYPDVTLVIQVGVPIDREQYIHRLGRTGREGKEGEGILLLAPWEDYFLENVKDLPLKKCASPNLDRDENAKIEACLARIDKGAKEAAYHSWLGYYNSIREISRDKTTLVELANQFCKSIGLAKAPALFRKTALKMGLKDIPGIKLQN